MKTLLHIALTLLLFTFSLNISAKDDNIISVPLMISEASSNTFKFKIPSIPKNVISIKGIAVYADLIIFDRHFWSANCTEVYTSYFINVYINDDKSLTIKDNNFFRTDFSIPTYNYTEFNNSKVNNFLKEDSVITLFFENNNATTAPHDLVIKSIAVNLFFYVDNGGNLKEYYEAMKSLWEKEYMARITDVLHPCPLRK